MKDTSNFSIINTKISPFAIAYFVTLSSTSRRGAKNNTKTF